MTAEESVERVSRECKNSIFEHRNDIVLTKVNALNAIEMAREEERENAIELHMKYCGNYRCPSNKQSFGNNQCSGNSLIMENFKNDLEK
jgi:hypothetical protein